MRYCEVVRDLAQEAGDWIWYDKQFRYLRQTAPGEIPLGSNSLGVVDRSV